MVNVVIECEDFTIVNVSFSVDLYVINVFFLILPYI